MARKVRAYDIMQATTASMVVSMKKEGSYTLSLLRAQNTFTYWLSRTCFRETSGFSLTQMLQLWVVTLPLT
jgi:hypothetical protein